MATVAMAREFDSLGLGEDIEAGAVEGIAECVGMQRLPPQMIGLLVTMTAITGWQKRVRLDKGVAFHRRIAGRRDLAFAEGEVVALGYLGGVLLTHGIRV